MSRGVISLFAVRLESNSRIGYPEGARMKAFRQLGIVILLLVSYLTPAMACMVSDVQMNAEERACCRVMKNQCEQMGMSAAHGCCQKAPRSAHDNALDTKATTYHPVVATIWLTASEWLYTTPVTTGWIERVDYSPPQSPPGSISVLRI
jgi:hypothetical protein